MDDSRRTLLAWANDRDIRIPIDNVEAALESVERWIGRPLNGVEHCMLSDLDHLRQFTDCIFVLDMAISNVASTECVESILQDFLGPSQ